MNRKNILIVSCIALFLVSFVTVTYSYFRIGATGNINANVGNILLTINGADSTLNEEFNVTLKRSETEEFIVPGDSGYFDINMNATGSIMGIKATVTLDRTGLPNNLKFFVDEELTSEYVSNSYVINKADTMVKTVRIYWYWEDIDDENDSLFIDKQINAKLSVSAVLYTPTFAETLVAGATLDTNVNFSNAPSSTNGQGLMMSDGTQDDEYPIVYYRGDVSDNNVIFADLCWLIVRTTETGGVKIVYNGPVNADGSCNNYSGVGGETANSNYEDDFPYSDFNDKQFDFEYVSAVHIGYMYNDDGGSYFTTIDNYWGEVLDEQLYSDHLLDNSRLDNGMGRYTQNKYDSTIKEVIDEWYRTNILNKGLDSLLEDTVWCNDRSVTSEIYSIENYDANLELHFSAFTRLEEGDSATPSLVCARDVDSFTVDRANGNGDLTYPIGLLTADELNMAGHPLDIKVNTYLTIPNDGFTTMSPGTINSAAFSSHFNLYESSLTGWGGGLLVRPSVSLSSSVEIKSGNGSFAKPYVVG